jgi:hypothetical protein
MERREKIMFVIRAEWRITRASCEVRIQPIIARLPSNRGPLSRFIASSTSSSQSDVAGCSAGSSPSGIIFEKLALNVVINMRM